MNRMSRYLFTGLLACSSFCLLPGRAWTDEGSPQSTPKAVKVFLLAGQSNMVGSGFVEAEPNRNAGKGSLAAYVNSDGVSERVRRLRNSDGGWASRDDVLIHAFDRKGKLTVGYGSDPKRIGPELGFGQVVGDAIDSPVLLIKLAWGGKSLAVDFRPPSSGGQVGPFYNELVERTRSVMNHLSDHFPELAGHQCELAGVGWHQGWNDRINDAFNNEYESNMAHFIRDLRRDLGVEQLPFVIAETGMSGENEKHPRALSLMKAQAAVATHAEFRGNVAFVKTTGMWRDASESPTGQAYHWNNNAETYYLIGEAMGNAMLSLISPSR